MKNQLPIEYEVMKGEVVIMNSRKRRGFLAFIISLVMVFSSFSLVFADDGYENDDEYGNVEIIYDMSNDVEDFLSSEMQVMESVEFGAEVVPAGGMPIQHNRVSAGMDHSFVIMPDNSLWGWGGNWSGQLGDGTTENRFSPIRIMDNVASVSAGSSHTMAITTDGSLWAWGSNWHGQLGDGTTTDRHSPVWIANGVASVSAGGGHTMGITADGGLWAWGGNWSGQLGDGTTTDRHSPVLIANGVASVSAGGSHTMAITTDGNLWGWGGNWHGQLGDNTTETRLSPIRIFITPVWTAVTSVSASGDYTMAILDGGSLWGWGDNQVGQLGDGTNTYRRGPVWAMGNVAMVSARNSQTDGGHTMAIRADGSLWGWGMNTFGQIGNGTTWDWSSANFSHVKVMENVAEVSTGFNHTIAITVDGCVWSWGANWSGQVGSGSIGGDYSSPVLIKCHTSTGNTPDPNRNLTHYYATMTASSSFNPINTPPHHANDNNTTANVWRPVAPGSGYLTARFDEAKNFNQVRIYQNGNRIRDYTIKYSNDGVIWNILYSGIVPLASTSTYSFTNTITAQYVRLVIGHSLSDNPAAVFQFDIRYMPQ